MLQEITIFGLILKFLLYIIFQKKIIKIIKFIYISFHSYEQFASFNFSYDLLKNSTKDKYTENLKQCGILDTYENKLCLYKDYPCPVNEIIVDLISEENNYIKRGYNVIIHYHILSSFKNYSLYFRNTSYDKKIISSIIYVESPPRLIDNHNFKFDLDAYEIKYGDLESSIQKDLKAPNILNLSNITNILINESNIQKTSNSKILNLTKINGSGYERRVKNWYDIIETKSKISQNPQIKDYINSELYNKSNDEDKNYTKLFDKIYYKNFIGFENAEDMDRFRKVNFTIYKGIFPDNTKILLVITFEVFLFVFIFIYYRKLIEDEIDRENICKIYEYYIIICGMSIYTFSFIFFFGFYINSAIDIFKNNDFYELQNIKCDQIIIDFLKEFIKRYNIKKVFVILLILFLFCSLILYILSIWFYLKKILQDKEDKRIANKIKSSNSNIIDNGINLKINSIYNIIENESNLKYNGINNIIENEYEINVKNDRINKTIENKSENYKTKNKVIISESDKVSYDIINVKKVMNKVINNSKLLSDTKDIKKDSNIKRENREHTIKSLSTKLERSISSSSRKMDIKKPNNSNSTKIQKKEFGKNHCIIF